MQFAFGSFQLELQRSGRGGDRAGVQWHLDQRGGAPRCRGFRSGLEAFPLRAARLVDVDVRVDDAGYDDLVADAFIGDAFGLDLAWEDIGDLAFRE